MQRRNFLIGVSSTAVAGSALLGSGAFSRVQSHRDVRIEVADDSEAYLGMVPLDTLNSQNYVATDENGHLYIQIDGEGNQQNVTGNDGPIGVGVNSDSYTYFDGMFDLCNNGKADATVQYNLDDANVLENNEADEQTFAFYYIATEDDDDPAGTRVIVDEDQAVPLEVGSCITIGVRTVTKGIDASDSPLVDGPVKVTAISEDAGQSTNGANGNTTDA